LGKKLITRFRNPKNVLPGEGDSLQENGNGLADSKESELIQDAVYRIALATDRAKSLEELFNAIHAVIGEVMPAENFYIALYDEKKSTIHFPYYVDERDTTTTNGEYPFGKGLTEYVIRTGKALLCDLSTHEELEERGEIELIGPASPIWLGVPLEVDGKIIGAMVVQHYSDQDVYSNHELRMLEFVSTQVAMAISRKRSEKALLQSEERYRNLFNHAPVGIGVADLSGKILAANPAMLQVMGYSFDELRDFTISSSYVNPDDRHSFLRQLKESGQVRNFEAQLKRKDGSIYYALINADLFSSEQRELISTTIRDITELVRTEEILRESEAKYRHYLTIC
jgi:PAS domain S-box-containing protein